ncbi:hypothetical protein J0S82_000293, partial [Galemys pyrenaicus]
LKANKLLLCENEVLKLTDWGLVEGFGSPKRSLCTSGCRQTSGLMFCLPNFVRLRVSWIMIQYIIAAGVGSLHLIQVLFLFNPDDQIIAAKTKLFGGNFKAVVKTAANKAGENTNFARRGITQEANTLVQKTL